MEHTIGALRRCGWFVCEGEDFRTCLTIPTISVRDGRQVKSWHEGTPLNRSCQGIRSFEAEVEDRLAVREAAHKEQTHGHVLRVDSEDTIMRVCMVDDI